MAVKVEVLFGRPQQEIATLLRNRLDRCKSIRIVSGFATIEGFEAIFPSIRSGLAKLETLVVGAATYRAYELLDQLLTSGIPGNRLRVHLGHTRPTGKGAAHSFYRYHPMLHSKVYMMEMADGTASVFIGSHNLTGFAMYGLNGEASVMLEGPISSSEMATTKAHIDECARQAVEYFPAMKDAYAWWALQFLEGLRDKADDAPREGEGIRTIVVLAVRGDEPLPKKGDVIYFEIPEALGQIESLKAEVHIYVFPSRPGSPIEGLRDLHKATRSYWCRTLGLEKERGGVELRADWQLVSGTDPRLLPTPRPFRPSVAEGMRQVRAKIYNDVFGQFEYLFPGPKQVWAPELSDEEEVQLPHSELNRVLALRLVPPEDKEWRLVKGLEPVKYAKEVEYQEVMRQVSPEGGAFILFSLRRREKKQ